MSNVFAIAFIRSLLCFACLNIVSNCVVVVAQCKPAVTDQEKRDTREIGYLKFDEYSHIPVIEERTRLDEFGRELTRNFTAQAYVIAYGGKQSWPGEARERADCVSRYLVQVHRIDKARITVVDGGFREEARISLYSGVREGTPPPPDTTLEEKDVQITVANRNWECLLCTNRKTRAAGKKCDQ